MAFFPSSKSLQGGGDGSIKVKGGPPPSWGGPLGYFFL